jgi:hypothetical protein
MHHEHSSDDMRRAVTSALECHRVCEETITYCLEQGGRHADASHIKLLTDCADICRTSADFMARGSEFHAAVCGLCADVCDRCAVACERFGDDEQMRRCAGACRQCAESCRRMAAMAA